MPASASWHARLLVVLEGWGCYCLLVSSWLLQWLASNICGTSVHGTVSTRRQRPLACMRLVAHATCMFDVGLLPCGHLAGDRLFLLFGIRVSSASHGRNSAPAVHICGRRQPEGAVQCNA
jgi:hypothetical protein